MVNFDYETGYYDGGFEYAYEHDYFNYLDAPIDLFEEFVSHRKRCSIKNIEKLLEEGETGGFFSKKIMIDFAEKLFGFMFLNGTFLRFKQGYESMIEDVKTSYQQKIEETVDEALSELAWNM